MIISNAERDTIISGGNKNDRIFNGADNVTINAYNGDDVINNDEYGTNDFRYGIIRHHHYPNNVLIDSGNGNDDINNTGDNSTINSGNGNDRITNSESLTAIYAGEGNDYIENGFNTTEERFFSSDGTEVSEYIYSKRKYQKNPDIASTITVTYSGNYSTLDGGKGNDRIYNSCNNCSISGGNGNDTITIASNANIQMFAQDYTINSGTGDDKIVLSKKHINNLILYAKGDGDDTIYGYDETDTINITSGNNINYSLSGSDLIINVADGSMLLKNVADKVVTLQLADDSETIKASANIELTNDIDYYSNIVSGGVSVNALDGNDNITNYGTSATINGDEGDDYITNYASLSAIFGGDGNDQIDNIGYQEDVRPVNNNDGGNLEDWFNNNKTLNGVSEKDEGGIFSLLDGGNGDDLINNQAKNVIISGSSGKDQITNNATLTSISGGDGNDLIKNIDLYPYKGGMGQQTDGEDLGHAAIVTINGDAGDDFIINNAKKVTINGGADSDVISLGSYHNKNLIQYAKGDGDDTIYGYNETDTIEITGGTYSTVESDNDLIVNVADESMLFVDAKGKTLNIIGEEKSNVDYIYLTNSDKSPYTADSDVIGIDASKRTKAIKIVANSNDNVLIGGSKNDTFTGGSGDDTFVSSAGKDIVTDYAEGDIVSIAGSIDKAAFNKNNVTFTSGKNTMTLQNVKGKKVTFIDGSGNVTKQTFGVNKLNIVDGDGSTINVANDATVITLDASDRTEDIILIGNAKANTLIGGSGDDELTGGKGKDLFIYSGGDDLITDYTAGQDIIQLANGVSIQSFTYTGDQDTDLVLQTNEGNLTIENAIALKSSKGKITRTPQQIKIIDGNNITTSQSYQFGTINTLAGAAAADTLSGFSTNDLLVGGKGKDVFIYGSGHDTIRC